MTLIALPLLAAWLAERWVEHRPERANIVARLGWLPVPLLAFIVFLIAASQINAVLDALPVLGNALGVFIGFLVAPAIIGVATAHLFALPPAAARTLIFSLGTRNSFVVLPLALALSAPWQTAVVVFVFQSLVELFGMVAYLWALLHLIHNRQPAAAHDPDHESVCLSPPRTGRPASPCSVSMRGGCSGTYSPLYDLTV